MTDKTNQRVRIIAELRRARSRGRTSLDLSRIALKYTSRVSELRDLGWTITCERTDKGYFRYWLSAVDW